MRRALLPLLALVAALGLLAVPAQAHQSNTIFYACTGYQSVASHVTAAGNVYESRRNVCVSPYSFNTTSSTWEGVVRNTCWRNNVEYGDGTGGCRWTGYIDLQVDFFEPGGSIQTLAHTSWCYTCGGTFVQDSGRHFSSHGAMNDIDSPAVRAVANNAQVRFYLADGSEVLKNEVATASGWRDAELG
jgi:hypothetical protein